jgi:type II secretory pathway pseudopilin PulG
MNASAPFDNSRANHCRRERGYILLALLLTMAVLSISFLTISEGIAFQIKRDREQEFIHRGLQYSRAVRRYVKQFNHYPTSISALENSNNMRFLRKRYKDPITGTEFKLLYYGDLETFYQNNASLSSLAVVSPQPTKPIAQTDNGLSQGFQATNLANNEQVSATAVVSGSGVDDATAQILAQLPVAAADSEPTVQPSDPPADAGGRGIVGVTSYSKHASIRIFNKKNHYNQWQFVYDPSTDTGLPMTPNQPLLSGAGQDPTPKD